MSGMVFHPGHHALHGVTVVVETTTGVTYVARFDREDEGGVHLLHVATHDPATAGRSRDEYLAATLKFGVKAEQPRLVLPTDSIRTIERLSRIAAP